MFLWARKRVASFTCGYLAIEFYSRAQNELSGTDGHPDPVKIKSSVLAQQRSWLPHWLSTPPPEIPVSRPSDDLRWAIVEYDVLTAVAIAAIVMSGGISGMAGAAAAAVLEASDDGPRCYSDLKSQFIQVQQDIDVSKK